MFVVFLLYIKTENVLIENASPGGAESMECNSGMGSASRFECLFTACVRNDILVSQE